MRRKKVKKRWNNVPIFSFTEETVQLVQRAIALTEQPLQIADHTEEKVVFAEELIQHIKYKLRMLLEHVNDRYFVGFDYNERIVIRHSLLLYTIELVARPPTSQQEKELHQCQCIATYFTGDEKHVP